MSKISSIHKFVASCNCGCPIIASQVISLGVNQDQKVALRLMLHKWENLGIWGPLSWEEIVEGCLPLLTRPGSHLRNLGKITAKARLKIHDTLRWMAVNDIIKIDNDEITPGRKIKRIIGL